MTDTAGNTGHEYILEEVDKRYSELAESSCCLSCGGAIDYAKPQENEICVDIGSGRGHDVLKMAVQVGEKGFAYGIDISEGMIKKARKNAKKADISNAEFIHTQLDHLQIPDETADLTISNCTINHAPDKKAVWAEIYRVLKWGGRFVVSDIYSSEPVPEEYASDPTAVAECWAGATTKEVYLQTLKECGFKDIHIIEESDPYPKGKIEVSSFTITGWKKKSCGCNCNCNNN